MNAPRKVCMMVCAGQDGATTDVNKNLQVGRFEAGMPGDSCQHAWPYFFAVMERKDVVRPAGPRQGFMRAAGLPFD